jgi:hypothetical protein
VSKCIHCEKPADGVDGKCVDHSEGDLVAMDWLHYGRSLQEVRADPYPEGDLLPVPENLECMFRCDHVRPSRSDVFESDLRCKSGAVWMTRTSSHLLYFSGSPLDQSGYVPSLDGDKFTGRPIRLCSKCAVLAHARGIIK